MRAALRRLVDAPIAHRGLHGCGRPGAPIENSIGAARAAVAAGYGIECDVVLTRDGEAMVFHDDTLDRLTRVNGRVAHHDVADLARLTLGDTDDRIPTLASFLDAIAGRVPVVIEIKGGADLDADLALTDRTLSVVAGYAGPAVLESFDADIVRRCLERRTTRTPVGLVGPHDDHATDPALAATCDFLSWSIDALPTIAAEHPGLPLTTWTVRTEAQRAVADRYRAQIVFEDFCPHNDGR